MIGMSVRDDSAIDPTPRIDRERSRGALKSPVSQRQQVVGHQIISRPPGRYRDRKYG
jgi:hypothetical protein